MLRSAPARFLRALLWRVPGLRHAPGGARVTVAVTDAGPAVGRQERRAGGGLVRRQLARPVTTNQVLIGVGLILVLAVGSQVLASRLKIPALIILLPAGFTAGAITTDVNPQRLLGAAFQPLVSLAVAVILYDAGMSLDLRKLRGHTRRVVDRLIVLGVPVTFAFGAVFAGLLLGMSRQAALMRAPSWWCRGRRWWGRCSPSSGLPNGCSGCCPGK